jgi:hypothetical protein
VHQPPEITIPDKEGKVLRLRKALYGLLVGGAMEEMSCW